MFKRILIAMDNSEPAAQALATGVELALELKAELTVLHVVDTGAALIPQYGVVDEKALEELERKGQLLLRISMNRVPNSIRATPMLQEGEPAETIVALAHDIEADLIVLGSDSRGRLAHFLLGSTADGVIRRAPCPVLSVRQQAEPIKPKRIAAAIQI